MGLRANEFGAPPRTVLPTGRANPSFFFFKMSGLYNPVERADNLSCLVYVERCRSFCFGLSVYCFEKGQEKAGL
jgi:hypothetical protein